MFSVKDRFEPASQRFRNLFAFLVAGGDSVVVIEAEFSQPAAT